MVRNILPVVHGTAAIRLPPAIGKVDGTRFASPVALSSIEHDVDRAVVPELSLNRQEQIHARPGHDEEEASPRGLALVGIGVDGVD